VTEYIHKFGFGDTFGIRQSFMRHSNFLNLHQFDWNNCGYPAHEGNPKLVELVQKLIINLTGQNYQYIIITNGATHALNAFLFAAKTSNTVKVNIPERYFGFYPGIIKNAGLTHVKTDDLVPNYNELSIIDSPSNPEGLIRDVSLGGGRSVWDAAYYTPTYCGNNKNIMPKVNIVHEAMVGSFSKLTGLCGLRLGWLAINYDPIIYQKAHDYVTYSLCGANWASQEIAIHILDKVDLNAFYVDSRAVLDFNKEELSKLNIIFGNQKIPKYGMFALWEIDSKLKKLLNKANVETTDGSFCGDDRESVRINLGHTNEATKMMVKAVLAADKGRLIKA
jgi:aspartate/methionine/tyrosine aminotransferase